MDQQAPHNLPFEPEDSLAPPVPPPTPPASPAAIPKVDLPPPTVPPASTPPAPSRFLSNEPSASMMSRPAGGPKQPEDMFAGLEANTPNRLASRVLPNDPLVGGHASYGKYILLICSLVAGLGIVGAGLWYFAIHRPAQQAEQEAIVTPVIPSPTTPLSEPVVTSPPDLIPTLTPTPAPEEMPPSAAVIPPETTIQPVVTTPPPGTNIPPPTDVTTPPPAAPAPTSTTAAFTDTDSDGLSDTREQELGTDPRNPDSDADNLTDGDEVLKYGTNPLKMDTDSDTYADGLEVKGGFDPRGNGKCAKSDCVQ
jgi:hypothetical protein